MNEVSVENRDDEFTQPSSTNAEEGFAVTRIGRVSRPIDRASNFPETSQYCQSKVNDDTGRWIKPRCFDEEDTMDKLSSGVCCQESRFCNNIVEKKLNTIEAVLKYGVINISTNSIMKQRSG